MDAQTKAFQALKPVCVTLGDAAKRLAEGKARPSEVVEHLEKLKRTLSTHSSKPGVLHQKLAEYVFFPISQVLRLSQKTSIQCLELSLQCVSLLIEHGWQRQLPAQTAAQFVILCTLLGNRKPPNLPFEEATEELQSSAFWCLYHVFNAASKNDGTREQLTSESLFPQLGQTISTTLDAIADSGRAASQEAACAALDVLLTSVADREVHASFLPGMVSKLTKTLTPSSKGRTSPRILVQCFTLVALLLRSTLGKQDGVSSTEATQKAVNGASAKSSIIDADWVTNAASQLKPALASMMRQKSHSSEEVRTALGRLCVTVLRDCGETLPNCSRMAMETLVTICADSSGGASIELEMLLNAKISVSVTLQELLYDWLRSLPTTMQGADEQAKVANIKQIGKAYQLLSETGTDMSSVDQIAGTALRDSVVVTIAVPEAKPQVSSFSSPPQTLDLSVLRDSGSYEKFESPLVRYQGQTRVLSSIEELALRITGRSSGNDSRRGLRRSLHQASGDSLTADFWLLLISSEHCLTSQKDELAFLDLPTESSASTSEDLEALYSLGLTVLTSTDSIGDDRPLRALALRALALRARSAGQDFRFELLDALYPVLHTLATPDDMLQRASITALNILTSACGYASVKELIVENVDYLVNAVALKMNAFDVSPQAPQVLLMMVKLAGPSLLPYLEDTIESIFAALEDYHGYPVLVELLFKVLSVMAEEGVKTPMLSSEHGPSASRHDELDDRWRPTAVQGLATLLKLRADDEREAEQSQMAEKENHPQRPWGRTTAKASDEEADDLDDALQDGSLESVEPTLSAPRTYSLLLKITELTQHFLPSASPSLRTSLLGLIRTTAPALAKHENSFLPLVNTLWPEVVARLDDDETHVVTTALDIVRVLCESAGDFMRSRVIQLWPRLVEIQRGIAREVLQDTRGRQSSSGSMVSPFSDQRLQQALVRMEKNPAGGGDTNVRLLWLSLQALIPVVVRHVRMPPEYVDQALDVASSSSGRQDVRDAFEEENSDALWLASVKLGIVDRPVPPALPAGCSWRFAAVAASHVDW